MKLKLIIQYLMQALPLVTTRFSDVNFELLAVVLPNGDLSFNSATIDVLNGLEVGQQVQITGTTVENKIDSIVIFNDDKIRIVTEHDHDYTNAWQPYVRLNTSPNSLKITSYDVVNRRTIELNYTDIAKQVTTANRVLEENRLDYNSWFVVKSKTSTQFILTPLSSTGLQLGSAVKVKIAKGHRIYGTADLDGFLKFYDQTANTLFKSTGKDPLETCTMAVMLEPCSTNRDRTLTGDNSSDHKIGGYIQQGLIERFTIVVAIPNGSSTSSESAIDLASEEIRNHLINLLVGKGFPPALSGGVISTCGFLESWMMRVTDATYFHFYRFEQEIQLTQDDSVYGNIKNVLDQTRAFRDINITVINGYNTNIMQTDLDLDKEPL